jgi:hypothetical protein
MKRKLTLLISAMFATPALAGTLPPTIIDATTYNGAVGTITFDDHGYTGPTVGGYTVGANDFQVGSGFDASRVGQIQNVVTKDPDWLTSDPAHNVSGDFGGPAFNNANMDATVNFFAWAYTTKGGSTFNNMTIDKAGNYYVAKNDMSFEFYDRYQYTVGTTPVSNYDTVVNFQPYAISDAKGWCGSVLTSDPTSLSRMAGQVTFDFAFDAYLWDGGPVSEGGTGSGIPMTQIVPDFVMRSYGSYVVDVTKDGYTQHFEGSAVENNTNPLTGELDPAFQNQVSFLGAGVVPEGVWVFNRGTADLSVADVQGTKGTFDGETRADGAVWHKNGFGGYAFLLRADGTRDLWYVNPEGHSDYVATSVPEPETYAMMLAGVGLVGAMAARRRRRRA